MCRHCKLIMHDYGVIFREVKELKKEVQGKKILTIKMGNLLPKTIAKD